jgi:arsenate reductase
MFVLGLQRSPRTKGNTNILLSAFLDEAERLGAHTHDVNVARLQISPCEECGTCEKEGFYPIDDDMQQIYSLLRQADIIVMASPVFFYGPTAQMKALIDRYLKRYKRKNVCQAFPGTRLRPIELAFDLYLFCLSRLRFWEG